MISRWSCNSRADRETALRRRRGLAVLLISATLLAAGCHVATDPDRMQAEYTAPDAYREFDCRELAMVLVRLGYQIEDLHQKLSKRHKRDQWQLAFSWFYGISGAFVDGDGAEAAAFRHYQGDFEAARVQAVRKGCGFEAATREQVFLNAKTSLAEDSG